MVREEEYQALKDKLNRLEDEFTRHKNELIAHTL
ncbi:hypothetical protein LCGC14_1988350 [marine sediment metagenome]|uniref:Uncharacterized protein n=1 Tax=marine sediment metagenome TaxID=412755 RepID=A0A0F9I3V9_9ZZZZ